MACWDNMEFLKGLWAHVKHESPLLIPKKHLDTWAYEIMNFTASNTKYLTHETSKWMTKINACSKICVLYKSLYLTHNWSTMCYLSQLMIWILSIRWWSIVITYNWEQIIWDYNLIISKTKYFLFEWKKAPAQIINQVVNIGYKNKCQCWVKYLNYLKF